MSSNKTPIQFQFSSNKMIATLLVTVIALSGCLIFSLFENTQTAYGHYYDLGVQLTPEGTIKLGVNQPQTFTATVSGGMYPYTFTWISQVHYADNTTGQSVEFKRETFSQDWAEKYFDGEKPVSTWTFDGFPEASTDYFTVTVEVTDASGAKQGEMCYVFDPYTSVTQYLNGANAADWDYKIETDGLGWYRAVKGDDLSICWTSTDAFLTLNYTWWNLPTTPLGIHYGKIIAASGTFEGSTLIEMPPLSSFELEGAGQTSTIFKMSGSGASAVAEMQAVFAYNVSGAIMDDAYYGSGNTLGEVLGSITFKNFGIDTTEEPYLHAIWTTKNALTNFENLWIKGPYHNATLSTQFAQPICGIKYYSDYSNIQHTQKDIFIEGYYYGLQVNGDHYVSNGVNLARNWIGLNVIRAFHSTFVNFHTYRSWWAGIYFVGDASSDYQDLTFINPSVENTVVDGDSNGLIMTDDNYAGTGIHIVDPRISGAGPYFVGNFTGFTFSGIGFSIQRTQLNSTASTWIFPITTARSINATTANFDLVDIPSNIIASFSTSTSLGYNWTATASEITITALDVLTDENVRCTITATYNPAIAQPYLLDYNMVDNVNTKGISSIYWKAQTFTVGNYDENITAIRLRMHRPVGSVPLIVTVSLRATAEGSVTGANLANGTIAGSSFTTDSNGVWYTIPITPYVLSANTQYAIVVNAATTTYDNRVSWRYDSTGSYEGGQMWESSDSGATWANTTAADFLFQLYGTYL
jgi:hypothetical protein